MNWGHSVQESNWKPCTVLIRPSDLTIKNQKHFVVKMAIVPLMSLSPLFLGNRVLSLFSIAVCWKKKKKNHFPSTLATMCGHVTTLQSLKYLKLCGRLLRSLLKRGSNK